MVTKEFITWARFAIFTVETPLGFAKSRYYVYRFRKSSFKNTYWVSLKDGEDFLFLGILSYGRIRVTNGSHFQEDSPAVRILRRVIYRLFRREEERIEAAGWKVHPCDQT